MDKNEYWKLWIKAAAVRALKTFAQTALGGLAVGMAMADVNWIYLLSVSAVASIASLLMSIAGLPEVQLPDQIEEK